MDRLPNGSCWEVSVDSSVLLTELLELLEGDTTWYPGSRASIVNSRHLSTFYSSASDTESTSSDHDHLAVKITSSLVFDWKNTPDHSCTHLYEEFDKALESRQNCKAAYDREQASAFTSQTALDAREGSSKRVASSDRVIFPRPVNYLLSSGPPSPASPFNLSSPVSPIFPSDPLSSPAKIRFWPRSGFSSILKAPLAQIFKTRPSSDQL